MHLMLEDVIKLLVAIVAGGLVGAEREFHDKPAGFRTIIMICLGSTLFTMLSPRLGGDPTRIAASIVTGVGFLGAGVILRDAGRVVGLTTASTVWLAAALGMGIGAGHYLLSGAVTVVAMIVLWAFPEVEERIDNARHTRTYEIVYLIGSEKFMQLESLFHECGLHVRRCKHAKSGDRVTCSCETRGSVKNHERLIEKLLADTDVKEFRF